MFDLLHSANIQHIVKLVTINRKDFYVYEMVAHVSDLAGDRRRFKLGLSGITQL